MFSSPGTFQGQKSADWCLVTLLTGEQTGDEREFRNNVPREHIEQTGDEREF